MASFKHCEKLKKVQHCSELSRDVEPHKAEMENKQARTNYDGTFLGETPPLPARVPKPDFNPWEGVRGPRQMET